MRRAAAGPGLALLLSLVSASSRGSPAVLAVGDELRLRRQDAAAARAAGRSLTEPGAHVDLQAFRGETVAFQIALVATGAPIGRASLTVSPFTPVTGVPAAPALTATLFREHTVAVTRRSRNDAQPNESVGWSPGARPPDAAMLGDVPDALIPLELDAGALAPKPLAAPGDVAVFWIDVPVPEEARPGAYVASGQVVADDATLARFAVRLEVAPATLPYRATSVFAFYEPERLAKRIGDGDRAERQLWQLLHAHHIDALAPLADPAEARRLAQAYDGTLFSRRLGYDGPGEGLPPAVAAIGAYGILRAPTQASLAVVDAIATQLRPTVGDLFVYAIDEECDSPRAADWVRALEGCPAARGVSVGQTCGRDPARQAAGIEIIPDAEFSWRSEAAATAAGKRAWIYNGHLPQTGTLMLDADPRGLIANGWIAAAAAIERWFYWETTFWDDDNRGGHGPVDPFVTAETFHNRDGDSGLGDGLLLYPGRQVGRFADHGLGFAGVLPSLRLKALRRGIQDAGIIALAMRDHPAATAQIVARAIPAVLDQAPPNRPASWTSFDDSRAALRALVTSEAPMPGPIVRAQLIDLQRRLSSRRHRALPIAAVGAVVALILAAFLLAGRRRK